MTSADWVMIINVWLILAVWQVVFGGLIVNKVGKNLVDGGWAWGRLSGWLVVSLLIWFLGHLKLPVNTINSVRGTEAILIVAGGWQVFKNRKIIRKSLFEKRWLILAEELVFLLGLIWLTWVRGHNPAILDLEKFMDGGFMQGYLRSPVLPAMDMWLSGEKVNYYTFGHFMGAVMIQTWGIDLAYSYNLLLGLIMGLTLTLTFSVVVNLIGRNSSKTILGGMVASVLMGFGGNTHAIWYWITHRNWVGYWYADATRFIYHTIHEFPAYSFVVSDLHGHVWDLPVVLMFLGILISWSKEIEKKWAVVMGILFGVMAMTNTWDVLIYGMLTGITGVMIILKKRSSSATEKVLFSWLVMAIAGVFVAIPFAINFVDIGQGVRLVTLRSPLWQLAVLWSGQLLITLIATLINLRAKNRGLVVWAMAISAVVLLAIPEFVYVKDIYPEHPRANTMFKLTYQAFVMMTIISGWLVANLRPRKIIDSFVFLIIIALTGGLMVFPYFAYRDYYGGLKTYQTLDGLAFLAKESPDDYKAILWMKKNIQGRPVILEAVGESYTQNGRYSVFTGLPTVLGWRVHEWLWRGGFDIPGRRTSEVIEMYEHPNSEMSKALISQYQIEYLVIGKLERETYHLDINGLEKLGKVVFKSGKTEVIELTR